MHVKIDRVKNKRACVAAPLYARFCDMCKEMLLRASGSGYFEKIKKRE